MGGDNRDDGPVGNSVPAAGDRPGAVDLPQAGERSVDPWQGRNGGGFTADRATVFGAGLLSFAPSAAGAAGYDATASGGSNLSPTNAQLMARVNADVAKLQAENPGAATPVDLVRTSGSGLDPDISPAAAQFQIRRVAAERKIPEAEVTRLVQENSEDRQWGFFGEPRTHVLELNIALDERYGRLH
jgi:K+-transporting ATPase KdpC subunit